MTLTEVRTWDYEAVEVGQRAQPIVTEVTPDSIVRHASTSRSTNPGHFSDAPPFAMPTQIFSLAPKNRAGVAENNGMTVITAHATPFAKAEGRWFSPIRLGDTVTSVATVLEKYERRGNKFVTLRLEAHNGGGEKLAEIDHTSIFEFRKSDQPRQDSRSASRPSSPDIEPSPLRETSPDDAVYTVTFETIQVGDAVHPFTIHSLLKTEVDGVAVPEDEMSGQSSEASHEPGRFPWGAMHGVGGITIMGYLDAMLHRWAPDGTLYGGGRLLFKAIKNFRPGDTNTYRGAVTAKREYDGKGLVDIEITGENQLGQLTGVAEATLVF
jgi:acyl dehydratase